MRKNLRENGILNIVVGLENNILLFIMDNKIEELFKWSNPKQAQKMAYKYLGKSADLYVSETKDKKYDIYDPVNDKWVSFGQLGYEDFTKHNDKERRKRYLDRATNIKGDWVSNPYSANNLSINILW